MTETLNSLTAVWSGAWDLIERGVTDRTAPSRFPVLASVGQQGGGEARMVVLRAASRSNRALQVHTDAASAKIAELQAEPRATLLIWDPVEALQLRLKVHINAAPGTPAQWSALPDMGRVAYGGTPPPGTPITDPDDWQVKPMPERFTILTARLQMLETLHLAPERHRRARFSAETDWSGTWVAP